MLLAIDVGNTNLVFAVADSGTVKAQWRAATKAPRTADEYAVWLSQLMALEGFQPADIDEVVISSVVPRALADLRTLCRKYFHCEPLVVGENAELGIGIRIDRPAEAGADRLVNAIAAHVTYGGPLIVLDSGTATTFDIVSAAGDFEGGVIAPGMNLSLEALHMAAASLPIVAIERPAQVIGKGTVAAMQSGVYWGYVGLIEGVVGRIKAEYGAPMTVVATGGLVPLFSDATSAIDHVDPDLTIKGLLEIHRRSQAAGA